MVICGDAASDAVRDEGGGRPGGAARPGGTTGERPGGTAGRPGGADGISLDGAGTGERGDATSGTPEPESDSIPREEVGDRGGGGGGGGAATTSLALVVFAVAGVIGRLGRDAGVVGRDEDACEDALAAFFFLTSTIAGAGVVVEPDRCCRAVMPVRRAVRVAWLIAFVLLCSAVLASDALLLLAQDAARGRPRTSRQLSASNMQHVTLPSASSPFLIVVVRRVSVSFIVCFLMLLR